MKKRRAMALITCPDFRFVPRKLRTTVNVHKWSVRPWPSIRVPQGRTRTHKSQACDKYWLTKKFVRVFRKMFKIRTTFLAKAINGQPLPECITQDAKNLLRGSHLASRHRLRLSFYFILKIRPSRHVQEEGSRAELLLIVTCQ